MKEFDTNTSVITNNLAEAQYLLERNHRLIDVEYRQTGSYETNELILTIQGSMVHQDRRGFLVAGGKNLLGLSSVLSAIQDLLLEKKEGGQL